ncbi:uncharacterized protein LOC134558747 [Prinia subflava]|uniref:uncharacterized protein LOC134558747 n=1 Tax=Prinia subflava TaxID=208062 RepID=UPI002FE28CE8
MEAPGRRCLRGGGAGSGRRAGGAAEPQTRGTSGLAVGIFNLHFQTPHTRTHTETQKLGGPRREGKGGARPRQSYYKTTTALPSPRAGTGLPRRDPRGSAPRSAGEAGGDTPRTTTTHNNTAAATTSPAACRGSKCRIWVENELKRLPSYSSSSSPRRGCHKILLKKKKKRKKKEKKKKKEPNPGHTHKAAAAAAAAAAAGRAERSAPRLLPPQLSSSHPSEPPCHRGGGGGEEEDDNNNNNNKNHPANLKDGKVQFCVTEIEGKIITENNRARIATRAHLCRTLSVTEE